jgi:hypothetical protein
VSRKLVFPGVVGDKAEEPGAQRPAGSEAAGRRDRCGSAGGTYSHRRGAGLPDNEIGSDPQRRGGCEGARRKAITGGPQDDRQKGGGGSVGAMTRRELVLAMLAEEGGRPFTPAQLQKAIFLICRNMPSAIDEGRGFNFVPYDYGPFDANVYIEAEYLRDEGFAIIAPSSAGRWNTYAPSSLGLTRGYEVLRGLDDKTSGYIGAVSNWVHSQSFGSLVKSIYEAYPEMKENSIFRD